MPVHPRAAKRVVLGVEVGHPCRGDRPCDPDRLVVRVDGHREPELVRRLPDRVVDGVAIRDARRAGKEDADELVPAADPPDLARCRLWPLRRNDDHPPEPRLGSQPVLQQPIVVGAAEPGRELRVREHREHGGLVGLDDSDVDAVRVEVTRCAACRATCRRSSHRARPRARRDRGESSPQGGSTGTSASRARSCPTAARARRSARRGTGSGRRSSRTRCGCRSRSAFGR